MRFLKKLHQPNKKNLNLQLKKNLSQLELKNKNCTPLVLTLNLTKVPTNTSAFISAYDS